MTNFPPARAALSYLPTELGNAQRLADESNGDVRWHPGRGWVCWTGTHWRAEDYLAPRLAADSARRYLLEAVNVGSLEQKKWGLVSESSRCIDATLKILRSVPSISISEDELDPDPWLLNCANGTVDLRTGAIRPPRRADMITMMAPGAYVPNGMDMDWELLMRKCHPDNPPIVDYLQALIGYGVTGSTREQMFVIHTGSGANGKGTFMHGLTSALGEYTKTARISAFLKSRNETGAESASPAMAGMASTRLVFAEEPDVTAKLDEGKLKSLTGQGRVSARHLRKDEINYEPRFLLQLLTNQLPSVWGRDKAIWRRIKVIPWTQDFRAEKDTGLYDRVASWKDQVTTWAVEGAVRYYAGGHLTDPPTVEMAVEAYRKENDRLHGWFPGLWEKDDTAFASRAELCNDYAQWVKATHGDEARVLAGKPFYDMLRAADVAETAMRGIDGFRLRDTR